MKFERICAYPNCHKIATYPAPRSPEKIHERIYFCLEHVQAYNKNWNGLEGFTGDEIFNMQVGSYWNRPTWAMGLASKSFKTATAHHSFSDPFHVFDEFTQTPPKAKVQERKKIDINKLPGQIRDACETLGTDNPSDETSIKAAYRKLAKRYHPDVNKQDSATIERIQSINRAYQTLVSYARKNK